GPRDNNRKCSLLNTCMDACTITVGEKLTLAKLNSSDC
ncbi:unnamed protein product, partial [Rotaria magnacalcarata]